MEKKKCTKCGITKLLTEFYKRKPSYTSTHQSECKACAIKRTKTKGQQYTGANWVKMFLGS